MKKINFLWGALFFLMMSAISVQAAEILKESLLEGTPYIDARYCYKFVD